MVLKELGQGHNLNYPGWPLPHREKPGHVLQRWRRCLLQWEPGPKGGRRLGDTTEGEGIRREDMGKRDKGRLTDHLPLQG